MITDIRNCPLCDSSNRKLLYKATAGKGSNAISFNCTSEGLAEYNNIYKCLTCGMVYQFPIIDQDKLIELYKETEDPIYLEKESERRLTFNSYLELLKNYLKKNAKVFEIGPYTGIFLSMLEKEGYSATGLELSKWASGIASQKVAAKIFNEPLEKISDERNETFDAVCLWDVFEHYNYPALELSHIFKVLKRDGYLFISTVDAGSFSFRILRGRYPFLMQMHPVYFSRTTIRRILENAGFEIVKIRVHKRYISKKYFLNRIKALFRTDGGFIIWIFKAFLSLHKKENILLRGMGLMDVVARKK